MYVLVNSIAVESYTMHHNTTCALSVRVPFHIMALVSLQFYLVHSNENSAQFFIFKMQCV
jgi:hypothetical protein